MPCSFGTSGRAVDVDAQDVCGEIRFDRRASDAELAGTVATGGDPDLAVGITDLFGYLAGLLVQLVLQLVKGAEDGGHHVRDIAGVRVRSSLEQRFDGF